MKYLLLSACCLFSLFAVAKALVDVKSKIDKLKISEGDIVDPTIRKIQQQARKYHGRFEVLNKTVKKWGPSTNLLARVARQSMQSRLDETRSERDLAKAEAKALKDMQKARGSSARTSVRSARTSRSTATRPRPRTRPPSGSPFSISSLFRTRRTRNEHQLPRNRRHPR